MEDRKNCGIRRNYLRPGIEKPDCGYDVPTDYYYDEEIRNPRTACACADPMDDSCKPESMCPGLPLAAAYVPMQAFTGLVGPDEALERGSSFENLFIPYKKGGCM